MWTIVNIIKQYIPTISKDSLVFQEHKKRNLFQSVRETKFTLQINRKEERLGKQRKKREKTGIMEHFISLLVRQYMTF